jgi:hypothetical protein
MTSHRRCRQRGLRSRAAAPAGLTPAAPSSSAAAAAAAPALGWALVTLVLVCAFAIQATAVAAPEDEPARPTEDQVFPGLAREARAATAQRPTEDQAFPGLARDARGTGAPTRLVDTRPTEPRAQPTDPGFDWGSAAAGAAGTAGLIALVSLGGPALNTRRRIRTAR